MRSPSSHEQAAFEDLSAHVRASSQGHYLENTHYPSHTGEKPRSSSFHGVLAHLKPKNGSPVQIKEIGVTRPEVWVPRVAITVKDDNLTIESLDQDRWVVRKDKNGGETGYRTEQRFGLPQLPLTPNSKGELAVRKCNLEPGFPSEKLVVRSTPSGLSIVTSGAHGQFNFYRASSEIAKKFNIPEGTGLIRFTAIQDRHLKLDDDHANDLEAQLLEGTLALTAKLIETVCTQPNFKSELLSIRERVEARKRLPVQNEGRGEYIQWNYM